MSEVTLDALVEIAAEAARLVADVYDTAFSVDFKGPRDPVTAADRGANELICRQLTARYPSIPIVAEESDPQTFEGYRDSERIFFVDPLDGTAEFVARNGEFAVMIGYVEGDRPRLGVIHAPARGTVYAGGTEGAWRREQDGERRALSVSRVATLADATLVASRSHRNASLERALQILGVSRVTTLGGAGLKGAAVAGSEAEAYVAPGYSGKRWDSCAAEAILTAAGGRLTNAYGVPLDYRSENLANDRGIIASNGLLHDAIVERLTAHRDEVSED